MTPEQRPDIASSGVAGIILAAGSSKRLGQPKQLLPLSGRPMIHWSVAAALDSHLAMIIVVTGSRGSEVSSALLSGLPPEDRLTIVANPRHRDGQSTSIAAGLAALAGWHCRAVMFLLADQPFVGADHINRLLDCGPLLPETIRVSSPDAGAWRPPVLIGRAYFGRLAGLKGDRGARQVVERFADNADTVSLPDSRRLMDIDTPEDYRLALKISETLIDRD